MAVNVTTNFGRKLAMYSIAMTASLAFGPAIASEVNLIYEQHPITSSTAELYWADSLINVEKRGELEPHVLVAKHNISGREIVVSMLSAMNLCGFNECPVRVFVNDKMVLDMNDCTNTDFHSLSQSGTFFAACDVITEIPMP